MILPEPPSRHSPTGGLLASGSADLTSRFWDLDRLRRSLAEMGLDW
jgi:hypothetical protein